MLAAFRLTPGGYNPISAPARPSVSIVSGVYSLSSSASSSLPASSVLRTTHRDLALELEKAHLLNGLLPPWQPASSLTLPFSA